MGTIVRLLEPINTVHLFAPLESKLIELLKSLADNDWHLQALPKWTVKDVAAHLLDTPLRRLSMVRDGYQGESFTGSSYGELLDFLNQLNADWVRAFRRISPPVLIGLMEEASAQLVEHFRSLDPYGVAPFAVSWAGEERSLNWFDIAREYTERWHHQQQIRDAVQRPGIMTPALYAPVLETFIRVLPHSYNGVKAPKGTVIQVDIAGTSGGTWYLRRDEAWILTKTNSGEWKSRVEIPEEIAWKLFTKAYSQANLPREIKIQGDVELAKPFLTAVAVMA
jgi:uncharacterized protein (TIGR03083 family)